MQERAEILHGTLEITSLPDQGTTVSLSMPLQHDEASLSDLQQNTFEEVISG
jgi:nitrate/nitrite-specific signal transduction histidine kinase